MSTNDAPGFRIARVVGVPVYLTRSWFLGAALIGFFYASQFSGAGTAVYVSIIGVTTTLLLSVFLHELAHALAARSVGIQPSQIVLTVWGGHTSFEEEILSPLRSAYVSLAGPAANALIALGTWLAVPAAVSPSLDILRTAIIYINAGLAFFNALPGLPLDGGRALEALIWAATGNRGTGAVVAGWVGRLLAIGVVVYAVVRPLLQGRSLDTFAVVSSLMIAALLWQGASAATQVGQLRRRSGALRAENLTVPISAIAAGSPIAALDTARQDGAAGTEVLVLSPDGRPSGIVDRHALAAVPAHLRAQTPVESVSRRIDPAAVLPIGLDGEALIDAIRANPQQEYLVQDPTGRPVGLLRQRDVAAALERRA